MDSGEIPEKWTLGAINPIYKNKGDENDADNYRGITLLSCLGKLFTSLLNERLNRFLEENKLLLENQAGFRKEHCITDHIFTLKSLIDIFLSNNRKLYCIFIDYQKAFDTVWRGGLWHKLISIGITGKILKVITNMYSHVKSKIRVNGLSSEFFESWIGLRQGENL